MAVERPPSAIWFLLRIKMQHYSCDRSPVRTFRIRVEQAQIRDDVLFVVDGQYGIRGRGIGYIGSSGGFCMGVSRNSLLGILMTSPREVRFTLDNGLPRLRL